MAQLSSEQSKQEQEYSFPYHYVPTWEEGQFSPVRVHRWGYEYLSYLRFVLRKAMALKFESLLDVGCGDGRFLHELSRRVTSRRLCGVDFSQRAIAFAKVFNPSLEFASGDISDPALMGGKFDVITLIDVLEHVPPAVIGPFVAALRARLSEGGTLLVTVPSTNLPITRKHYQHFSLESLQTALSSQFELREHRFLNSGSFKSRLLRHTLVNRLWALNNAWLLRHLYGWYERKLLPSTAQAGTRIFALCTPRQ